MISSIVSVVIPKPTPGLVSASVAGLADGWSFIRLEIHESKKSTPLYIVYTKSDFVDVSASGNLGDEVFGSFKYYQPQIELIIAHAYYKGV